MTSPLEALIEALEAADLNALLALPEQLALATKARETVVNGLQAFDFSSVPEEERARLKPRLQQVIERDRQLLLQVEEARNEASVGLSRQVSGRALARGYGGPQDSGGAGTKRIG
jgi:hypothetical protein